MAHWFVRKARRRARFEQVATLIRDNRLAEAEKELDLVSATSRLTSVALNLMGTIRAKQDRLIEAETLFLRAVKNDNKLHRRADESRLPLPLKRAPDKAIVATERSSCARAQNADVIVILRRRLSRDRTICTKPKRITWRPSMDGSTTPARCSVSRRSRG